MSAELTYQWVVIINVENDELRVVFGPFSSFETATSFEIPPGVSEDSSIWVTRLHEPFNYVEG